MLSNYNLCFQDNFVFKSFFLSYVSNFYHTRYYTDTFIKMKNFPDHRNHFRNFETLCNRDFGDNFHLEMNIGNWHNATVVGDNWIEFERNNFLLYDLTPYDEVSTRFLTLILRRVLFKMVEISALSTQDSIEIGMSHQRPKCSTI